LKFHCAAAFVLLLLLCGSGWAGAAEASDATRVQDDPTREVLVVLHLPAPHFRPGAAYGGSYSERPGQGARQHAAAQLAQDYGLTVVSGWAMPDLGVDCYVMRVEREVNIADLVRRMSQDQRAQWVQPMHVYRALARADSLQPLQPSVKLWHLDELHKIATGRGVTVAILDSGVDTHHPDLFDRVASAQNFVDAQPLTGESHGTAVAGIIGARADDGARIVGIAPQARLLALRACWEAAPSETLCSSFTLAKALQFAIRSDANVINLSLAGPEDELLGRLIDVAAARGATIVAAVDPHLPGGGFPASHAGVLAVADAQTPHAAQSARVLVAPGDDVPTTAPGAQWRFVSGNSFAAAHVTGMAALVREVSPASTMRDASAWVRVPAGGIDACATLRRAAPALRCNTSEDHTVQASW